VGDEVESVDTFLARAELGGITATEVEEAVFESVFRGGYDESEVDNALDVLIERLTGAGPSWHSYAEPRFRLSRFLGN
jgi:DivIVA domain-containing protein